MPVTCILIIDDDADTRMAVNTWLQIEWPTWRVMEAGDGPSGICLACREHPDLILLNGRMPLMNGPETARTLRRLPATQAIPLIGLTAVSSRESIASALRSLCDAFLSMPFPLNDLRQTISHIMGTAA